MHRPHYSTFCIMISIWVAPAPPVSRSLRRHGNDISPSLPLNWPSNSTVTKDNIKPWNKYKEDNNCNHEEDTATL